MPSNLLKSKYEKKKDFKNILKPKSTFYVRMWITAFITILEFAILSHNSWKYAF